MELWSSDHINLWTERKKERKKVKKMKKWHVIHVIKNSYHSIHCCGATPHITGHKIIVRQMQSQPLDREVADISASAMKTQLVLIAVWALLKGAANAECPDVEDVPVMNYDADEFTCARIYHGPGADSPLQACNECKGIRKLQTQNWEKVTLATRSSTAFTDYPDNYNDPGDWDSYLPCGSLVVKPGCLFHGYGQPDFPEWKDSYEGPLLVTDVASGMAPPEEGCASG
jgi:hypothetical protein